jgi:hypothetical protein
VQFTASEAHNRWGEDSGGREKPDARLKALLTEEGPCLSNARRRKYRSVRSDALSADYSR